MLPNEDLGSMNRIWNAHFEVLFKGVSTLFGLRNIEKYLKMRILSFVHASKIFVWGAYICECFLCNNIARMGYKTQPTCEIPWWSSDVFFVTTLQGLVYKQGNVRLRNVQWHERIEMSAPAFENYVERIQPIVGSDFQNLRLGGMKVATCDV